MGMMISILSIPKKKGTLQNQTPCYNVFELWKTKPKPNIEELFSSRKNQKLCVVWCGVVWCGVVWCGVVWCGVVWCGVVWCGVVWCGVVWCGVVWCGVVWCGAGDCGDNDDKHLEREPWTLNATCRERFTGRA